MHSQRRPLKRQCWTIQRLDLCFYCSSESEYRHIVCLYVCLSTFGDVSGRCPGLRWPVVRVVCRQCSRWTSWKRTGEQHRETKLHTERQDRIVCVCVCVCVCVRVCLRVCMCVCLAAFSLLWAPRPSGANTKALSPARAQALPQDFKAKLTTRLHVANRSWSDDARSFFLQLDSFYVCVCMLYHAQHGIMGLCFFLSWALCLFCEGFLSACHTLLLFFIGST